MEAAEALDLNVFDVRLFCRNHVIDPAFSYEACCATSQDHPCIDPFFPHQLCCSEARTACDAQNASLSLPPFWSPKVPFADENVPDGVWEEETRLNFRPPPELVFLESLVDDVSLFLILAGFFLERGVCRVVDVSAGHLSAEQFI